MKRLFALITIVFLPWFLRDAEAQISPNRYHPQPGSDPYSLIDLDHFWVQDYGYCKLGLQLGASTSGHYALTPLANSNRQFEIWYGADPSNFFLNLGGASLNDPVVPFPDTTVWDTTNKTVSLWPDGSTPPLIGQDLRLYRYFHFPKSLTDELTGANIGSSTKKAVILIHGWNGSSQATQYDDSELALLKTEIKIALTGTDWKLITYKWSEDADTGLNPDATNSAIEWAKAVAGAAVNGTEAAEISHQHGQHLGELLDVITQQKIEKIHFITHSAGAWNARAAAKYLLSARANTQGSRPVKIQITMLDPFIPAAVPWISSSLSTDAMSGIVNWTTVNENSLFLLENYYAPGAAAGTQEIFDWRSSLDITDINFPVSDSDLQHADNPYADWKYDHFQPVESYAWTVKYGRQVSSNYPNVVPVPPQIDEDHVLPQTGWQASIFSQEPQIVEQPHFQSDLTPIPQVTVQPGDSVQLFAKISNRGRVQTLPLRYVRTTWQIQYSGQSTWNTLQDISGNYLNPEHDTSVTYNVPTNLLSGTKIRLVISNTAGTDTSNSTTLLLNGQQANASPSAPTNLQVTPISSSALALAWNGPSGNETGFRVERSSNGGSTWATIAANLPKGTTTFTDSPLLSSTPYTYRVAAFNPAFPTGTYSNTAQATTLGPFIVTHTLAVQSVNPNSGISVLVDPVDRNGATDGYTPLIRTFSHGASVLLSVPSTTTGGKLFQKWQRNNVDYPSISPYITVVVDADYVFSAVYVDPPAGGNPGGIVAAPVITPPGGTFTDAVSVSMTCATSDAVLRYTTDGTQPTIYSQAYTGSFIVAQGTTVTATAFKPNTSFSATSSADFTISYSQALPTPVISPNGGTSLNPLTVGIFLPGISLGEVYYTVDGSIPQRPANPSSFQLPVSIYVNRTMTIKARAFQDGMNPSAVATATFTITNPQNNDNFVDRIRISGPENAIQGSNVGATSEAGEPRIYMNDNPDPLYWPPNHSVWWVWRAPYSGSVTFDTSGAPNAWNGPSNFDTRLGVFTGSSVASLTTIGGADDGGYGNFCSKFTFDAVGGTDYNIVVDGWGSLTGRIELYWKMTSPPPPLPPYTPTNIGPPDGGITISHRPTLAAVVPNLGGSLPFKDFNPGDTHAASQWIVTRNSDSAVIFDSGEDPNNKESIHLPSPLASNTSYSFTVRHEDSSGLWSDYSSPTSFTTPGPVPITVNIAAPVQGSLIAGSSVAAAGSATAAFTITEVRWTTDFGDSGIATPGAAWTTPQIPIHPNENSITISVKDDDGNTGTASVQFTALVPDTTNPTLTISFPTTGAEFDLNTTQSYLSGSASDEGGVASITWTNDRGGSGTATGTGNWTVGPITFVTGDNAITVRATDLVGNFTEKTLLFHVTPPVPLATTLAATAVLSSGATLKGTVNPNGSAHFEYGLTTAYGKSTANKNIPEGTSAVAVQAVITELPPNTTYHYRAVGTNSNGPGFGLDRTFTTLDNPELVGTWAERTVVRNLPTVVGNTVDIGTLTFTGGTGSIEAAVNASGTGWSVAKRYVIPIRSNLGNGSPSATWLKVLPTADTGPFGVNDFDLNINVTNATALLRLRTVGSNGNATTARISIKTTGLQTFVNSAATSIVSAPTQTVVANALEELNGKAGIGAAPSGNSVIDVNGGDTRGLRLHPRSRGRSFSIPRRTFSSARHRGHRARGRKSATSILSNPINVISGVRRMKTIEHQVRGVEGTT